jgi:hypothetical protein
MQIARKPGTGAKLEISTEGITSSLKACTLNLHDCGWIHGAFRSSNIIFFPLDGDDTPQYYHLQDPYIVGFNYSRPSDPTKSTLEYSMTHFEHDMYRHPQVAQFASRKVLRSANDRQRFQIAHDLYALGVVLLEIGLWRRVGTLWKDKYDYQRFLEKLISAYVPRLGPKMGNVYRDVVRGLLSLKVDEGGEAREEMKESSLVEKPKENPMAISLGDDGEKTKALGMAQFTEIYWNVVQKLGQCSA